MHSEDKKAVTITTMCIATLIATIALGMWGCPTYNVYSSGMSGRAELARAEQNRQIAVHQAKAKVEASKYEADADIERARGVAEANRIIGESLKGNEGYLRYLWIQGLAENDSDVIYVPTEANLPILEATRSAPRE